MKKVFLSGLLFLGLSVAATAQTGGKTKTTVKPAAKTTMATKQPMSATQFKTLIDSFSYAAGYNVATNMQAQGISELNTAMMTKGIEDVFKKRDAKLTQEVINTCMQRQLAVFSEKKGAEDKSAGIAFLAANAKRDGVVTLKSGLQYEIIKNGDAASPTPKAVDTVEVNYKGSLIDGTEFDNSFKRGEAAAFPVMGVIKGWIEILQLMRKGDNWKVFIPSDLAYGAAGAGQSIPPNAVLVFEITLEAIRPAVAAAAN